MNHENNHQYEHIKNIYRNIPKFIPKYTAFFYFSKFSVTDSRQKRPYLGTKIAALFRDMTVELLLILSLKHLRLENIYFLLRLRNGDEINEI